MGAVPMTDDLRERAARAALREVERGETWSPLDLADAILAEVRAEIRNAALEEAAKIADLLENDAPAGEADIAATAHGEKIRDAIRALKEGGE